MTTTSTTRPIALVAVVAARCLASLAALRHACAAAVRAAFAQREEPVLDDATLRDLGISRSELASFEAEATGRVKLTRRRVCMRSAGEG